MGFGDVKKAAGLTALNAFLADRSYIEGYTVSQADVVVYQAMAGTPSASLNNALRWYNQVKSYSSQFSSLPGIKKALSEYGPGEAAKPAAKPAPAPADDDDDDDDDDDIDLFGETNEEEEAAFKKSMEEKRKAEESKKKAKPAVIAKSTIILDVKPWDDETNMAEVESLVRTVTMDGLVWGSSKLVPVGYGIKKLQITCVVEDDKVGTDDLEEKITAFEEHVQSVDIAAFQKV